MKSKLAFPIQGDITVEDIERAQNRLLQMAVMVRDIFEKNKIDYTLMFGSLLGSVREQSFIPWDLDFDLGVPDDQYEYAMKCIADNLPDYLVIQNADSDPYYCASWSKVVDLYSETHSTEFPNDNLFKFKGIHVDIYRLKPTSEDNFKYNLLCDNLAYYELKKKKGLLTEEEYQSFAVKINNEMQEHQKKEMEADCYYFLSFFLCKKTDMMPMISYKMEHEIFKGPANYRKILAFTYCNGDFMVPPVYEKRDLKIDKLVIYDWPI